MKIPIFLLLMAPALPLYAQEHTYEHQTLVDPTVYKKEIKDLEIALLQPGSGARQVISEIGANIIDATQLLPGQDYFPAELFLNNEIDKVANPGVQHQYSTKSYNNVDLNIGDEQLQNLTCYVISDKYKAKGKKTVSEEFQYDNTYFLYKDNEGKIAYTVYYIENTIDFLKTEYRIVKKGGMVNGTNTLLVAPNPADKNVTLSYTVNKAAGYSLKIKDMNGKTVYSILDNESLEAGDHISSIQVNLTSGTYLVSLESNDAISVSQKLIIR